MITEDMYQQIATSQQRLDAIIKRYSDGKHRVDDVVQRAWELGTSLKRTIRLELWQSRFTLQQSARSMYRLMSEHDLFPSTHHLVAPEDVPKLLGFEKPSALSTVEQQVQSYFQSYEYTDYDPRSFYFYKTSRSGWIDFQDVTMMGLVEGYTDLVSFITNQPTSSLVISVPTATARTDDQLNSDLYVLDLLIQHHKSHIYDKNDQQMTKVYQIGKSLQYFQATNEPKPQILDDIAQRMRSLVEQHIISPAPVSSIVTPKELKQRGIDYGTTHYVHYEGTGHPLNVRLLSQVYQKILGEVFGQHRLG